MKSFPLSLTPGGGGTVDNAAVNDALAENPAASREALKLGDVGIIPDGLVSDAKRHSNGVVSGTTLTCASATFAASGEVGKTVRIEGAGTAATVTLTRTGNTITGSSGLTGGSVGGYTPNALIPITITGGGGSGALAYGVTNSSGQVASVVIRTAGSGYTSDPSASFPTADHVTTIAARVSNTQVTLAVAAPTAIGANAVFYYGTDNSTAIQTAINNAYASLVTRRVIIPNGNYLANVRMRINVTLAGSSSMHTEDPAPSDSNINGNLTTRLEPILMGASAAPIIDVDLSYGTGYAASGTTISFLSLYGSSAKRGFGIRYGIATGDNTGFMGGGFVFEKLMVSGFKYGISVTRAADLLVRLNDFTGCKIACNFGEEEEKFTSRYTDGVHWICNAAFGNDVAVRFAGNKSATVADSDIGQGPNAITMDHANVVINNLNIDSCSGQPIVKTNGELTINSLRNNGDAAPCVSEYGTSGMTYLNCGVGGVTWGASTPQAFMWRGPSGAPWPSSAAKVGVMIKYSDTTWSNIVAVTRSVDNVGSNDFDGENGRIVDRLYAPITSPFGSSGWVITGISGSFISSGSVAGLISVWSNNTDSTNVGRFAWSHAPFWSPSYYHAVFKIRETTANTRNSKIRVGLYSLDASFTPTDGYGLRYDPTPVAAGSFTIGRTYIITSAGDTDFVTQQGASSNAVGTVFTATATGTGTGTAGLARIWVESINNGSITQAETGVLGSVLTSDSTLFVSRTPQGVMGTIKGLGFANCTATQRGVFLAPAILMGAINTQMLNTQVKYFSLQEAKQ